MSMASLAAFALVALIGISMPGPTVLLALSNGSRFGFRRAIWGMLGAALSDFVLIGAVAIGLGALLAASEFWFSVVKWLGAAYLAFLGIQMLRAKRGDDGRATIAGTPGGGAGSPRALFLKCFLVAVTNPKGYLFFSAFLPQFVSVDAPQLPQYALLAIVFASIDLIVMAAYAVLGARAVSIASRSSAALWLSRLCGGALLALAGSLAHYRRMTN